MLKDRTNRAPLSSSSDENIDLSKEKLIETGVEHDALSLDNARSRKPEQVKGDSSLDENNDVPYSEKSDFKIMNELLQKCPVTKKLQLANGGVSSSQTILNSLMKNKQAS